ncbi:DUF1772 domain-containing protein [Vibrio sp. SM6]|uniref:DUF1772 domain-containing protein n=1 Tax=Vibrio agarilyticus TaxID=2726741 RepID=A0A7X8TSG7_9VIBR|nr:anthrone oxygenase family protein [Vibrio agarilyticus]NLS13772.1 DUF1772 domain-containing protein [Vibrio agarilyticus]
MNSVGTQRKLSWLENGSIGIATLLCGLMVGLFWSHSQHIGVALAQLDGKTFAQVQSVLHVRHRQLESSLLFFGTAIVMMIAVIVNVSCWNSSSFWLMALAALIYFVGVLYVTRQFTHPLAMVIDSWDHNALPTDWQQVRAKWLYAQQFRFVTAAVAFTACMSAIVLRANLALHR